MGQTGLRNAWFRARRNRGSRGVVAWHSDRDAVVAGLLFSEQVQPKTSRSYPRLADLPALPGVPRPATTSFPSCKGGGVWGDVDQYFDQLRDAIGIDWRMLLDLLGYGRAGIDRFCLHCCLSSARILLAVMPHILQAVMQGTGGWIQPIQFLGDLAPWHPVAIFCECSDAT